MTTSLNEFHTAVLRDRRAARKSAVFFAVLSLPAFGLAVYITLYAIRRAGPMRMDEVLPGAGAAVVGLILVALAVRGLRGVGPWTDERVQAVTSGSPTVVWIYKKLFNGQPILKVGFEDGKLLSLPCESQDAMGSMFAAVAAVHPSPEFGLGWEPGKVRQFQARYPR